MTEQNNLAEANTETMRKRKKTMFFLAGIFIIMSAIWTIYYLIWGQFKEFVDDAYVSGNIVQLMPQISGTVVEILSEDTQLVKRGQVIVKLDSEDYKIRLQQAKAGLAVTVRQVRQYFENVNKAKQALALTQANLLKAEMDVQRRQGLVGNRAVSKEEMQHYRTNLQAAEADHKAAQYQLDAALALIQNTTIYKHPQVESAKANLRKAWLDYQRTTILAPVTGYIAKRSVHPGQQVAANTPMMAIIPLKNTWIDANYKESSLNHIRINQPAIIYVDAYPNIRFHGKVVGLSAGTGAAFALLPPQNATGNWIKIVQRLPVRIQLDPQEVKKNPVQLGLSTRVTVDTHNRKGTRMPVLANTDTRYETDIYHQQMAGVEAMIQSILEASSADRSFPEAKA